MTQLPIIDLRAPERETAQQIADACRAHDFFYVVGHDLEEALGLRQERLSHQCFALPAASGAMTARYAMTLRAVRRVAMWPRVFYPFLGVGCVLAIVASTSMRKHFAPLKRSPQRARTPK
jgi:non-haem dioxygenase in morphine synthesis N-terminal